MKTFIKENRHLIGLEVGFANGYVAIPPGHPYHGKSYDDLNDVIDVHYGLTFSENSDTLEWEEVEGLKNHWVIGFDTCHYGDTPEKWTEAAVIVETERLKKQVVELQKTDQ